MTATPTVLRALLTPPQFKSLKVLAVERDLTLSELVTTALRTAPATREAFKGEETDK